MNDIQSVRAVAVPSGRAGAALESRLADRLVADFDADAVHVAVDGNRRVETLAFGRDARWLGPQLPPRTVGLAVSGDPTPDGSPGDPVELWPPDSDDSAPVVTGALASCKGDVAASCGNCLGPDCVGPDRRYLAGEPRRALRRSAAGEDHDGGFTRARER